MTFLTSTQLFLTQNLKTEIKRISPTVFHKNEMDSVDKKIPFLGRDKLILQKSTLIFPKSYLNFFLLTIYLLFFVDVFFIGQSTFVGLRTVLSFWYTCPFILRGRIPTGNFQEKEKKLVRSCNFTFRYIDDVLSLNNF